jgi:hypothetical protein
MKIEYLHFQGDLILRSYPKHEIFENSGNYFIWVHRR